MNRRDALSTVSLILGGTVVGSHAFLTGCQPKRSFKSGILKPDDMILLEEVAETILPTTENSPGAKAAGVGEFMNPMITDCYPEVEQQIFTAGLVQLESTCKTQYGDRFIDLKPEQRHQFLLSLEKEAKEYNTDRETKNDGTAPQPHYYSMIKQLTLLGYFTSEIGQTQALRYLPVPGKYQGCIPYNGEPAWG
ncbi:MAG: gluconate 2-dehydrogenase subunit 3 family protein [Bacteroidetes bacterium]|nr:gluconate 2-dehydrogenase subunit 3 family protein [Bacteroidota bacterium]MDA1121481.1 gluconate 2-dehydrogenase subunit 3 family protein [Bacteroidota bacterium]